MGSQDAGRRSSVRVGNPKSANICSTSWAENLLSPSSAEMKSEEVGFSASLVPLALGGVSPVFVFSVGGKPFVAGDASRLVCLDGSADCDGVDSAGVLDSVLGLAVVKFFCFACSFFFWSLFFLASEGMFKIYVNEFVSDKFL